MLIEEEVFDELKQDFEVESKKRMRVSTYIFLLLVLLIPLVIYLIIKKPYSFVSSFENLPEPEQIPTSGFAMMKVFGKNFEIDFLSSYDINGKVIAVKDFNAVSDFSNKLSPKDYVLGWGFMGIQENIDRFTWDVKSDDSIVLASVNNDSRERLESIGGTAIFQKKYSNVRLIPSDKRTRSMLKRLDVGDNIKIKGYLASVHTDDGSWQWGPSCVSAVDKLCEVIYVTDITRLREF